MSSGTYIKVSECCEAYLNVEGGIGNYYDVCSKCGQGRWPMGCNTKLKYYPSDFEKGLIARIEALEREVETLKQQKNNQ